METGAHVWFDSKGEEAWTLAEVASRSPTELKLFPVSAPNNIFSRPIIKSSSTSNDGEPLEIKYEGVELANAKLSDAEKAEGKDDDMITLPHLHEPAILHAISERFNEGKIYTWTGPVLIAVNPFQRLPLYTKEILETYRRAGLLKSQGMGQSSNKLGPHIYAIADLSYRQMMAPARKSQAILISGESGAGKTESTKIVMLYLTTLGTASINDEGKEESSGDMSTMEKVLQSNPILEAFGNARTLRNDNSSRFGKFIELGFTRSGSLVGAKVQTYLLEKVRLGFHASGERNYHIFYQLLRGIDDEKKERYGFHDGDTGGLELANFYHYTGQGGAPGLREFTDEDGLKYTMKAMKSLGWDESKVDKVLSLVAGLLHLGQMTFNGVENDGGQEIAEIADEKVLQSASELLGVNLEKLKIALTERILITRGDAITIQLAPSKAADSRDALAKTIYGALFLWVVSEVNSSIVWKNDSDVRSSVGVLDIFGFECFAVNSFEQLCINFTNEALQQQFNKFIFKMEQAEYEREEIQWDFIAFPDNQDCLDIIQSKPTGILAMLDDECRLGARGNDKNWADRLYKQFIPNRDQQESENGRFSATPIEKGKSIFCVKHFAGSVKYTATTGFLEKNKDEIPVTAKNLFDTSDSWLIKEIYDIQKKETEERSSANKPGKPARSKTVGQQFKEQLNSLMDKIESTEPHYIRCLKSNDAAKPKMMTRRRVTEQLRYGGVLEAVRVARMGFPVRMNHELFFEQYRLILPSTPEKTLSWRLEGNAAQSLCVRLLELILEEGKRGKENSIATDVEVIGRSESIRRMQPQPIPLVFPKTDVQLGKNKVFMRKPAHDALEAHRVFHQTTSAIILQAWMRGISKRVRHIILCDAVSIVQRFYRGCKGRERWWKIRKEKAGDLLTNTFRMLIVWRRFNRAKKGTIQMQAVYRGHSCRRNLAAIKIQTVVRMCKKRYAFKRLKSATIGLQCQQRRGVAKKELAGLKGEQKDIGKLKANNEKLKFEMNSLKAMLQAQAKGDASREESEKILKQKEEEISKLEKHIADLEKNLQKEKERVTELETELSDEKTLIVQQKERIETLLKQQSQNVQIRESVSVTHSPLRNIPASPKQKIPSSPTISVSPKVPAPTIAPIPPIPAAPAQSIQTDSRELNEQRALVNRLEAELEHERKIRRDADGEVIKLRAQLNGVELNDADVKALLPTKSMEEEKKKKKLPQMPILDEPSTSTTAEKNPTELSVDTNALPPKNVSNNKDTISMVTPRELMPSQKTTPKSNDDKLNIFNGLKSPSDYFPMIKRGLMKNLDGEGSDSVVAMGWKVEVTSRKEREEALRDDVHRFEAKLGNFYQTLEQGLEVTMWQLNSTDEINAPHNFTVKGTQVQIKLHRRGDFMVQAALVFTMKGGYLSKALNRHKVDKAGLDPLSVNEILEVKAGCEGYNQYELPTTGKTKKKSDYRHSSLFLTLKAAPTPIASSRLYFLKFKSRSARNDLMMGLRGLLADLQINEGVSISSPVSRPQSDDKEILVPLSEANKVIDKEKQAYDRLLLMMLQGSSDLKSSEDDMLKMREGFERVVSQSKEKDRIQANDSKLIMQLSKKLETLLMDNEDLRDQNENLNNRLVAMECEQVNK